MPTTLVSEGRKVHGAGTAMAEMDMERQDRAGSHKTVVERRFEAGAR